MEMVVGWRGTGVQEAEDKGTCMERSVSGRGTGNGKATKEEGARERGENHLHLVPPHLAAEGTLEAGDNLILVGQADLQRLHEFL